MTEVEADPALGYVFHKTGVYVCEENYGYLSEAEPAAFNAAGEFGAERGT
jgi:hypothetical protein